MESVYQDLAQTNFVSAYSMTTMYEDFADFATVYLLHTLNLKYELKIYNEDNEVIYDQNKHFFDRMISFCTLPRKSGRVCVCFKT